MSDGAAPLSPVDPVESLSRARLDKLVSIHEPMGGIDFAQHEWPESARSQFTKLWMLADEALDAFAALLQDREEQGRRVAELEAEIAHRDSFESELIEAIYASTVALDRNPSLEERRDLTNAVIMAAHNLYAKPGTRPMTTEGLEMRVAEAQAETVVSNERVAFLERVAEQMQDVWGLCLVHRKDRDPEVQDGNGFGPKQSEVPELAEYLRSRTQGGGDQ